MFENIIKAVEKELKGISDHCNDFYYQESDPEGPSRTSKCYKEYKILSNELKQLKETINKMRIK